MPQLSASGAATDQPLRRPPSMTNAIEDQRPAGAPPTPAEELFTPLLTREAAGRGWLAELLRAAPGAEAALGELAEQPGWLQTALAVRGARQRLACFEYPAVPSPQWLTWMIDHPDALTVPEPAARGQRRDATPARGAGQRRSSGRASACPGPGPQVDPLRVAVHRTSGGGWRRPACSTRS